jgi:hypothetical protein
MQRLFTSVHYLLYLHHQWAFYQQTSDQILNWINQIIEMTNPVDAIAIENLEHGLWEIGGELLYLMWEINHILLQIVHEQWSTVGICMYHSSSNHARNAPHKANWLCPIIPRFPPLGRWTRWGWNSSGYLQTRPIPLSTWECVDMPRYWPRSRRSRAVPSWPFMSNYIDEQAEYI